jgi:hypothetical protein
MMRMAENGQIPHAWCEPPTFSLLTLIYGETGLDIHARLWADRLLDGKDPPASKQERFEWTAQFGVGIPELMAKVPRFLYPLATRLLAIDLRLIFGLTALLSVLRACHLVR